MDATVSVSPPPLEPAPDAVSLPEAFDDGAPEDAVPAPLDDGAPKDSFPVPLADP
jgi:hypothetical protein